MDVKNENVTKIRRNMRLENMAVIVKHLPQQTINVFSLFLHDVWTQKFKIQLKQMVCIL